MIPFIVLAGLLVAGALLLLLPPLFGAGRAARAARGAEAAQAEFALAVLREQLAELDAERAAGGLDDDAYARSREELERRALEDGEGAAEGREVRPARRWAAAVAAGVPVVAAAIYLVLGNPDALDPAQRAVEQGFTQAQVEEMVGGLVARLEQEPDNADGWAMLARSWTVLGNYHKAVDAYARLAQLMPGNPDVLAAWADAVATRDGKVVAEAEALAKQALAIDPDHVQALVLAGAAAHDRADYAGASALWERILTRVGDDHEAAQSLRATINEARAKGGLPPLAEAAAASPAPAAASALTLSGQLALAPELAAQAAAGDTVFVFVRGSAGGPPLAALRLTAGELPASFSFANAPRMGGDGTLPEQVMLVARVSKSGEVAARAGDLEGSVAALSPQAQGVTLVIDRVRP